MAMFIALLSGFLVEDQVLCVPVYTPRLEPRPLLCPVIRFADVKHIAKHSFGRALPILPVQCPAASE